MNWFTDNLTKILGTLTTMLSTLVTLSASGALDGLMSATSIRWLGVIGMLVGSATVGRGFNNTGKEKIASAMQTAIKAMPGSELPPEVLVQATTKPTEEPK